jgi:hypothetical protein
MKTVYVACVGLTKGLPVSIYSDAAELNAAAGKQPDTAWSQDAALNYANKYLVEKGSLVEGRDVLSDVLEKQYSFPMLTKTVTKKFKTKPDETAIVPDETEKDHINRFRKAVLTGEHIVDGVEPKEAALEAFLQGIVDGKGPFAADASKPERTGKSKLPPQYALKAADNVIKNGSQAKWVNTFTQESVPFEDFQTPDLSVNRIRLAWAIKAREDAKAEVEYN